MNEGRKKKKEEEREKKKGRKKEKTKYRQTAGSIHVFVGEG